MKTSITGVQLTFCDLTGQHLYETYRGTNKCFACAPEKEISPLQEIKTIAARCEKEISNIQKIHIELDKYDKICREWKQLCESYRNDNIKLMDTNIKLSAEIVRLKKELLK